MFLGPPGVGKTHLADQPGIRTAERGRRVYSGPLRDLVGSLEGAGTKGAVAAPAADPYPPRPPGGGRERPPGGDPEVGRPCSSSSSVSARASVHGADSNKGFEERGAILGDEVMAAAPLDRLLHHCHLVNIRGNSYRMRDLGDLAQALRRPREEQPRTRAGHPSGDAPAKRHARRARISGRSAPSVRARRAHPGTHPLPPIRPKPVQIPSTHPSADTKSHRKSGTFSKPIDTRSRAMPAGGQFARWGARCRAPSCP